MVKSKEGIYGERSRGLNIDHLFNFVSVTR